LGGIVDDPSDRGAAENGRSTTAFVVNLHYFQLVLTELLIWLLGRSASFGAWSVYAVAAGFP
jgi:hypothetical protein